MGTVDKLIEAHEELSKNSTEATQTQTNEPHAERENGEGRVIFQGE